jgi:hypothetical protein
VSRCPACREKVQDISKRFDSTLGFTCVECWTFLLYAEIRLSRYGIRGTIASPERFTPKTEKP